MPEDPDRPEQTSDDVAGHESNLEAQPAGEDDVEGHSKIGWQDKDERRDT